MKIAVIGGGSTYTPELIEGFARRSDVLAYEQLVDRLLASPHHGERWGSWPRQLSKSRSPPATTNQHTANAPSQHPDHAQAPTSALPTLNSANVLRQPPEPAKSVPVAQLIPLGRGATPEEAADGIYCLCSPGSNYVHGQVLAVSGGISFGMAG